MKRLSITALLIFSLLFPLQMMADRLSEEDKKEMQDRVRYKVEEFQNYLSSIVNTNLSNAQRKASISSALDLFIGSGEEYVINEDGYERLHKGVRMQVSSVTRGSKYWEPMKSYLNRQYANVRRYSKVVIDYADAVRVDNITQTPDGRYEAAAYFCQRYIGYSDGRIKYGDITTKKVKVYIDPLNTPKGIIWDIKLGDVYVTETEALN